MGLHTSTPLNRRIKSVGERTVYAGRFNIGPRLILGFVFIILSMLAADAVILWQFHLVRTQAERLNGIDQKLVAVLRVHTSLLAFHDRLEELADSQDVGRLVAEGGPKSRITAGLEDYASRRNERPGVFRLSSLSEIRPSCLRFMTFKARCHRSLKPSPRWPHPATGELCTCAWQTK